MRQRVWMMLALLCASATATANPERQSGAAEQTALAVTIYNGDLALVKDARKTRLDPGANRLAWREVSARIQPETALLRALDGRPLRLLEQNFDFDLLTPRKLLEKSVGETVRVIRPHVVTGVEASEYPTLIAANEGFVLKYADRVETGLPKDGRLAFTAVPPGLRDRPTLSLMFEAAQGGDTTLELSYLTGGLTWKADYVAELRGDESALDLNGWVTLTNTSGTGYRDARLQLVAGEVNRVMPAPRAAPRMMALAAAEAGAPMQQEALFEYHLYTLDRPTTLLDNQTKQVALLSAASVPVSKEYRLQGAEYYYQGQYGEIGQRIKAGVFMEFANQGGALGVPLPKGIVRVYKKDSAGRAQFIGEDRIEHTAKNETVRLKLGEAFDITADKRQTDYMRLAAGRNALHESGYQIEIRNAKSEPIRVRVVEPMPGDWQILAESLPHRRTSANTATWDVPVPAEGKAVLSWRVRVRQ